MKTSVKVAGRQQPDFARQGICRASGMLVEEPEPGVWTVRTATVIPDNERWLHAPAVKESARARRRRLGGGQPGTRHGCGCFQKSTERCRSPAATKRSGDAKPHPKVAVDLNNAEFLDSLLSLDKDERNRVLNTIAKVLKLTWAQVYTDPGLKWERSKSRRFPRRLDTGLLAAHHAGPARGGPSRRRHDALSSSRSRPRRNPTARSRSGGCSAHRACRDL